MGIMPKPVDYNLIYVITANNTEFKTHVDETVQMYKSILDVFNIKYNIQEQVIFTKEYHLKRGYCCNNGCKHCPYDKDS